MKSRPHFIIGIDEAGRGPLAGPVAVGIACLPSNFDTKLVIGLKGKDSKKLSEAQREEWFKKMGNWKKEGKLDFHAALISSRVIDARGIGHAIKSGIKICLKKVKADCQACSVLLDGGLKAPSEFSQKTIIKGDEKEIAIGLASIAAKVTRDRYMKKLVKKAEFKSYHFEIHKGYGTKAHRELIKKHGPSAIHRKSFLKNILQAGQLYAQEQI